MDISLPADNQRLSVQRVNRRVFLQKRKSTHVDHDLLANLRDSRNRSRRSYGSSQSTTYVYNPNRWPGILLDRLVVLFMVFDSLVVIFDSFLRVPSTVL